VEGRGERGVSGRKDQDEEKIVELYGGPDPDLPEPTLKQYFLGWGAVFAGLVLLAVILGLLMCFLR
jgi:hypothetical protein